MAIQSDDLIISYDDGTGAKDALHVGVSESGSLPFSVEVKDPAHALDALKAYKNNATRNNASLDAILRVVAKKEKSYDGLSQWLNDSISVRKGMKDEALHTLLYQTALERLKALNDAGQIKYGPDADAAPITGINSTIYAPSPPSRRSAGTNGAAVAPALEPAPASTATTAPVEKPLMKPPSADAQPPAVTDTKITVKGDDIMMGDKKLIDIIDPHKRLNLDDDNNMILGFARGKTSSMVTQGRIKFEGEAFAYQGFALLTQIHGLPKMDGKNGPETKGNWSALLLDNKEGGHGEQFKKYCDYLKTKGITVDATNVTAGQAYGFVLYLTKEDKRFQVDVAKGVYDRAKTVVDSAPNGKKYYNDHWRELEVFYNAMLWDGKDKTAQAKISATARGFNVLEAPVRSALVSLKGFLDPIKDYIYTDPVFEKPLTRKQILENKAAPVVAPTEAPKPFTDTRKLPAFCPKEVFTPFMKDDKNKPLIGKPEDLDDKVKKQGFIIGDGREKITKRELYQAVLDKSALTTFEADGQSYKATIFADRENRPKVLIADMSGRLINSYDVTKEYSKHKALGLGALQLSEPNEAQMRSKFVELERNGYDFSSKHFGKWVVFRGEIGKTWFEDPVGEIIARIDPKTGAIESRIVTQEMIRQYPEIFAKNPTTGRYDNLVAAGELAEEKDNYLGRQRLTSREDFNKVSGYDAWFAKQKAAHEAKSKDTKAPVKPAVKTPDPTPDIVTESAPKTGLSKTFSAALNGKDVDVTQEITTIKNALENYKGTQITADKLKSMKDTFNSTIINDDNGTLDGAQMRLVQEYKKNLGLAQQP